MNNLSTYYVIKSDYKTSNDLILLGRIKDYRFYNYLFKKQIFWSDSVFLYFCFNTKSIIDTRLYIGYPIVSINNIVKLILKS